MKIFEIFTNYNAFQSSHLKKPTTINQYQSQEIHVDRKI